MWAKKLTVGAGVPTNLPYRFTIRFPDAKTKTISGVFNNISEGTITSAVDRLKVEKSLNITSGEYVYSITPL